MRRTRRRMRNWQWTEKQPSSHQPALQRQLQQPRRKPLPPTLPRPPLRRARYLPPARRLLRCVLPVQRRPFTTRLKVRCWMLPTRTRRRVHPRLHCRACPHRARTPPPPTARASRPCSGSSGRCSKTCGCHARRRWRDCWWRGTRRSRLSHWPSRAQRPSLRVTAAAAAGLCSRRASCTASSPHRCRWWSSSASSMRLACIGWQPSSQGSTPLLSSSRCSKSSRIR